MYVRKKQNRSGTTGVVIVDGTQLILNQVFRLVGFDVIEDDIGTGNFIVRNLFQRRTEMLLKVFRTFATTEKKIEKVAKKITVRISATRRTNF